MCPEDTGHASRRSEHPNGYALRRTGGGAAGQVRPGPRRRIAWEPAPDGSEHGYERVGAHTNMHAIGVDIGGTKIAAGVVDEDGTILAKTRRDTSPDDVAGIDKAIAEVVPRAQRVLRGRRRRGRRSRVRLRGPVLRPVRAEHRVAGLPAAAEGSGDPRGRRRRDRRRERRQRRRLGRVPVRCRARRRRHAAADRGHRPGWRHRVQREARARCLGRRRRDRAHARGPRRSLLRLRSRRLLGAVRLGQRAGPGRAGHRHHPPRAGHAAARARRRQRRPAHRSAGHAGGAGGRPARPRAAHRARPVGRRGRSVCDRPPRPCAHRRRRRRGGRR